LIATGDTIQGVTPNESLNFFAAELTKTKTKTDTEKVITFWDDDQQKYRVTPPFTALGDSNLVTPLIIINQMQRRLAKCFTPVDRLQLTTCQTSSD